jgi:hypothetical protein
VAKEPAVEALDPSSDTQSEEEEVKMYCQGEIGCAAASSSGWASFSDTAAAAPIP